MSSGVFQVPTPINEPILQYGANSAERTKLKQALSDLRNQQN
jgi:1-pyrroline-5-carboxylate dehydrogenase